MSKIYKHFKKLLSKTKEYIRIEKKNIVDEYDGEMLTYDKTTTSTQHNRTDQKIIKLPQKINDCIHMHSTHQNNNQKILILPFSSLPDMNTSH